MTGRAWHFDIQRERREGILILGLRGRLDGASAPALVAALAEEGDAGVLVDLERLDYISGPGLAALGDAAERADRVAQPFVLCGLTGSVRIAFELAGLLPALRVEADRAEGLARLAG